MNVQLGHEICAVCERYAPAIHHCPALGGFLCDECAADAMAAHRLCKWLETTGCDPSKFPPATERSISPPNNSNLT